MKKIIIALIFITFINLYAVTENENKMINVLFSDSKYSEMIGLYIIAIPIGIVNAILMIFIFRSDNILIITFKSFLYTLIMIIVATKLVTVFSKKLQNHFKC